MPSSFSRFMKSLAIDAGKILLKYFNKTHQIRVKPRAGIVTEADQSAEDFILRQILRKFPESSINTEESGEIHRERSLCWVIDPLDGTSNYAHGFPWFCVSIALYVEGEPKYGVIHQPITHELFFVELGKEVTLNEKPVVVSKTSRLRRSLLGTGFYYARGDTLRREMEIFSRMNEEVLGVRRPGSAALDLACVACGRFDGFWERGLAAWDVAAGFMMVEEAGGVITDYAGAEASIYSKEVIASNGRLHKKLVSIVNNRKMKS